MSTAAEPDVLKEFEWPQPCQTHRGCDREATVMVWVDHHLMGCAYSGFRCDVHLNQLVLDTRRHLEMFSKHPGNSFVCARCSGRVEPGGFHKHLRWVRI